MASGLPVIATRIVGVPELVLDGCGLLVPPARPTQWLPHWPASRMIRSSAEPSGRRGAAEVHSEFNLERSAEEARGAVSRTDLERGMSNQRNLALGVTRLLVSGARGREAAVEPLRQLLRQGGAPTLLEKGLEGPATDRAGWHARAIVWPPQSPTRSFTAAVEEVRSTNRARALGMETWRCESSSSSIRRGSSRFPRRARSSLAVPTVTARCGSSMTSTSSSAQSRSIGRFHSSPSVSATSQTIPAGSKAIRICTTCCAIPTDACLASRSTGGSTSTRKILARPARAQQPGRGRAARCAPRRRAGLAAALLRTRRFLRVAPRRGCRRLVGPPWRRRKETSAEGPLDRLSETSPSAKSSSADRPEGGRDFPPPRSSPKPNPWKRESVSPHDLETGDSSASVTSSRPTSASWTGFSAPTTA